MKREALFLFLMVAPAFAEAQQSSPISEFSIDGIYATKTGDPTLYCLLGANACLMRGPHDPWNDDALIESWLTAHPTATAIRISAHTWVFNRNQPPEPRVYLWIEDGKESLNIALVREGRYPAAAMEDMVDADHEQAEMDKDPRLAQFREQMEKERAETPEENRPHRLVSDADYAEKMFRISRAEIEAKQEKKGMWSDSGLKGRTPPQDDYLIRQYENHRQWFERIRLLVREDRRLAEINRDPKTSANARSAGVPPKKIEEYVDLLTKLDANEELVGVAGLGETCLVVADITYGLFDNGIIKGYVFSPSTPHPLVEDLENWPSDVADATTAYKPVADNWYLFELHH